jgi:hypothetical protein
MKTGIIIIILLLILVVGFIVWRNKTNKIVNAPREFVRLKSKKESNQHLPLVSKNWITEIERKWSIREWGIYDNVHYDISNKICNDVYSKNKYCEKNQTHAEFLNELTKEQRIYFTLVNFEGQVNNGGVYQFLFNNPELSIIALQGMQEVGIEKLAQNYEIVLQEYFGKFNTIQELYSRFQNENNDWNKRWNSFAEGYKELQSTEIIEDYFYQANFVKIYQEKLTEYVKANPTKLYKTE